VGNPESLLTQKDLLISELACRGVAFQCPPRKLWHDYSAIDLVIAVRDPSAFLPSAARHKWVERKPPNKLINAWLAQVPAILSPEPSYLMLKKSHLDFLEARNLEETLSAVDELICSPELYCKMVENSRRRAADYGIASVVRQWKALLDEKLLPLYRMSLAGRLFQRPPARLPAA
jgi:hypothetical protein